MSTEQSMESKTDWEGLYAIRHYVVGSMTILKIGGKAVTTGSTPIFLNQLNGEKLMFISKVLLPEDKEILLGIAFKISENIMEFIAHIKGVKVNEKKKQYTYLVEFVVKDDKERMKIVTFLNKIQLANKQKKLRNITETAIEVK
ncbi:hypothetical protein [Sutcliffiella deserti]|uniref:hypothetical protein n=1 Tax=Sutcliffiella deserti TaxID=2875501 RepID=UPI001CBD9815|nr:hypothetical protein [Sutcliffiella deserti]